MDAILSSLRKKDEAFDMIDAQELLTKIYKEQRTASGAHETAVGKLKDHQKDLREHLVALGKLKNKYYFKDGTGTSITLHLVFQPLHAQWTGTTPKPIAQL